MRVSQERGEQDSSDERRHCKNKSNTALSCVRKTIKRGQTVYTGKGQLHERD